jgi:hypothetical protein
MSVTATPTPTPTLTSRSTLAAHSLSTYAACGLQCRHPWTYCSATTWARPRCGAASCPRCPMAASSYLSAGSLPAGLSAGSLGLMTPPHSLISHDFYILQFIHNVRSTSVHTYFHENWLSIEFLTSCISVLDIWYLVPLIVSTYVYEMCRKWK